MKKVTRRAVITTLGAAGIGTCIYGLSGCATFTKVGSTPAIPADAYTVDQKKVSIKLDRAPELLAAGEDH
jgi:hypothetical protein